MKIIIITITIAIVDDVGVVVVAGVVVVLVDMRWCGHMLMAIRIRGTAEYYIH